MRLTTCAAAVLVSVIGAGTVHAETATGPEGKPAVESGRSESLSRTLSESGGVIKPSENIDPGMKVPAPHPEAHPMPVIPPSATGGNTAK